MDYGTLKHVLCNPLLQKIIAKLPSIVSKDPTVDACRGPKPNSQQITKTDGLYKRRVLNICG